MNTRIYSFIKKNILILFIILIFCNNQNSSQENIALQYLDSFYNCNWISMSHLLHPIELKNFRSMITKSDKEYEILHKDDKFKLISDSVISQIDTVRNKEKKLELFYSTFMEIVFPNDIMKMLNEKLDPKYKIIGVLNTDSDTSYVVYKISVVRQGKRSSGEQVLSLKKYQNEWRVLFQPEIKKMIQDRL